MFHSDDPCLQPYKDEDSLKCHNIQRISETIEFRMMKAEVTDDERIIKFVDPDLSGNNKIIVLPLVGARQQLIIQGDCPHYIRKILEKKQFPCKVSLFLNQDSFNDYVKYGYIYDWLPWLKAEAGKDAEQLRLTSR